MDTVQAGYYLLIKEQINLLYPIKDLTELYPNNVFPDAAKQDQVTNQQGLKVSRNEMYRYEELVNQLTALYQCQFSGVETGL